jgi:SYP5 family syntaxin
MAGSQLQDRGRETEVTAELDNRGLVQLQQQVMQQQDQELEQMEKTVISTKV